MMAKPYMGSLRCGHENRVPDNCGWCALDEWKQEEASLLHHLWAILSEISDGKKPSTGPTTAVDCDGVRHDGQTYPMALHALKQVRKLREQVAKQQDATVV